MKQASADLKYEQAAELLNKIQLIKEVTSQQYKLQPEYILPTFTDSKIEDAMLHLKKIVSTFISLPKNYQFNRIEGYDVSNIMGKDAAVSMIVFANGKASNKQYRLFNIKTLDTPNDYQMLKEALIRRQNHQEWGRPNLIVIDGGKGQLRAAISVWQWANPIISIAKNPDRIVIAVKKETNLKLDYHVIKLPANHPTLHLIQQIRDESHRFAKKQHERLRMKKMLEN